MGFWIQNNWAKPNFTKNYPHLFGGLKKKSLAKFYIPLAMMRKGVFVTLILIFRYEYRYFLFPLVLLMQVVYFVYTCFMRPYSTTINNVKLLTNEFMLFMILCFSAVFIEKEMNNDTALNLGWVWISLCSGTILANWVFLIYHIALYKFCKSKQAKDIKVDDSRDIGIKGAAGPTQGVPSPVKLKSSPKKATTSKTTEGMNVVGDDAHGYIFGNKGDAINISGNNNNVRIIRQDDYSQIKGRDSHVGSERDGWPGRNHDSSGESDQNVYEAGTTIGASSKSILRSIKNPSQKIEVKPFEPDTPTSERFEMFRNQRTYGPESLYEESKEEPRRNYRKFSSDDDGNMSYDSSNSGPGMDRKTSGRLNQSRRRD